MSLLEEIIQLGNRPPVPTDAAGNYLPDAYARYPRLNNIVNCADGFSVSVIAGAGPYCTPRVNMLPQFDSDPRMLSVMYEVPSTYPGPFSHVEVGFPTARPEPWEGDGNWESFAEDPEDPTHTVYPYVPVDMVRALIYSHGDEAELLLPGQVRRASRHTAQMRKARP